MTRQQKILKETEHFVLVQLIADVALDIYNDDKLNNFYVICKEYNTVETGQDSINMALYALYQAEQGYLEALAMHSPVKGEHPVTDVSQSDKKLN